MKLVGAQFHIHDGATMQEVAVANQKGFKLKEDIRVSVNGQEQLGIFARQVIDFGATYDIVDLQATPNLSLGSLRRKGWKSAFLRDEWYVVNPQDQIVGLVYEDSPILGMIRRYVDFVSLFLPQNYDMEMFPSPVADPKAATSGMGHKVADYKQNFNPFTYHLNVLFLAPESEVDRRIILASAILLAAIEGRQRGG